MPKVLILACYFVFVSCVNSKYIDNPKTSDIHKNNNVTILRAFDSVVSKALNQVHDHGHLKGINNTHSVSKNGTLLKSIVEKIFPLTQVQKVTYDKYNASDNIEYKLAEHKHYSEDEARKNFPMLQKIHARITRSKDAIWATITLTALCILLVLAVAQSRMWKDHYYTESQGVPLPNFNERVLFKDVMERKISSLKQFFKKQKHTKQKNETELESLLPPSEWD